MACVSIQYCKDSKTFAHPAKKHTTVSDKKIPAGDTEYRQGLQTPVGKEPRTSNPAGVEEGNSLIFCNPCGVVGCGSSVAGVTLCSPLPIVCKS